MEEYRGKSPFPAVRCPPPPPAAYAHARGGRGGLEDTPRGLRGRGAAVENSAGRPRGLNLMSGLASSEHLKDRDRDLIT